MKIIEGSDTAQNRGRLPLITWNDAHPAMIGNDWKVSPLEGSQITSSTTPISFS